MRRGYAGQGGMGGWEFIPILTQNTTTTCVYLDRQIALPIWGATHGFFLFFF